jgi:crossover junction endodeoxyribonuclease RusA
MDRPEARVTLTMPWPPTINTYWRNVNGRTILSRAGREYRTNTLAQLHGTGSVPGRIAVTIFAHPPDRRRRDLDNLPKSVLDALTHASIIQDDSMIDDLRIIRAAPTPGGKLTIMIEALA